MIQVKEKADWIVDVGVGQSNQLDYRLEGQIVVSISRTIYNYYYYLDNNNNLSLL